MARTCCLAAIAPEDLPLLTAAVNAAFAHADASIAEVDVSVLRALHPDVLIIDIDRLEVDPIEAIRQLRFVLPDCVIVVYTTARTPTWSAPVITPAPAACFQSLRMKHSLPPACAAQCGAAVLPILVSFHHFSEITSLPRNGCGSASWAISSCILMHGEEPHIHADP